MKAKPSMVRLALRKRPLGVAERLRSPLEIAAVMRRLIGDSAVEHFWALHFTGDMELLSAHEVSRGGFTSCPVDQRVLFSAALLAGATALVVCHNHPSGSLEPSRPDIELTSHLRRGAELLGLKLLDHLIVTPSGSYYSFEAAAASTASGERI